MSKLISANFARLFKSGVFILYMIFSGGLSIFMILMRYIDYIRNTDYYDNYTDPEFHTMDGIAFIGLLYIMFAIPVFIGNFICTEYSDGTIRNKLIVGHKRSNIYLANLVVCTAGTLMGVALHLLINFTIGTALCGMEVLTVTEIAKTTLYSIIALIAWSAIMVVISMLVGSKAGSSVTMLILAFIMFFVTISFNNMLTAPEYFEYSFDPSIGETVHNMKNPDYLTGTKRKVYQAVYDAMPIANIYEYNADGTESANKCICYDGALLVVTTALGIVLFRRKDLK